MASSNIFVYPGYGLEANEGIWYGSYHRAHKTDKTGRRERREIERPATPTLNPFLPSFLHDDAACH